MFKRGFTLIELMVVIAIVAVLAAASIGAYKQYSLKTKVTKAINAIEIYAQDALKDFELTNAFPGSQVMNGVTIGCTWALPNAYVNLSDQHLSWVSFCKNDSTQYIQYTFMLAGLEGIPGYNESNSSAAGTGDLEMVSYAIRLESDGTYSTVCGHYDTTADSVPLEYLPSACQCADVLNWVSTGSCS